MPARQQELVVSLCPPHFELLTPSNSSKSYKMKGGGVNEDYVRPAIDLDDRNRLH